MESAPNATPLPEQPGPQQGLLDAFGTVLESQTILQFLEAKLATEERQTEFVTWVRTAFPCDQSLSYVTTVSDIFPGIDADDIAKHPAKVLHASALGFRHTPKVPLTSTCLALAERIVTEGFSSGAEPVLIMRASVGGDLPSIEDDTGHLKPMFTQYFKGQARCLTLLALLVIIWEDGTPWTSNNGGELKNLCSSIGCIYVHAINVSSLSTWIIDNATFASRGATRKPWNIVQWMDILLGFKTHNKGGVENIIKAWNEKCVKSQQLVGAKRMALTHLLGFPRAVQTTIWETVSIAGWTKCPYTEDLLGSKKIIPGSKRSQGPKSWQPLTLITEESLLLFVRHVKLMTGGHGAAARRICKADMEDLSTKIAIGYNLVGAVQEQHAIPRETFNDEWLDKITLNDPGVMSELHCIFMEKPEKLNPSDLKTFDQIITKWKAAQTSNLSSPAVTTYIEQAKLEEDAFQLFLNRIRADLNTYATWQKQCANFHHAVYFKEKEYHVRRYEQAKEIAESWIRDKVVIASAEVPDASRVLAKGLVDAKSTFMSRHTNRDMSVAMVVNLNWAAPALVRSDFQTLQKALACEILDEAPEHNVALMVTPKYANQNGTLWVQQVSVLNWAGSSRLNCDLPFSILFKQRHHKSDQRPLNYDGRILFNGNTSSFMTKSPWKGSSLVEKGFVSDVEQLKTQNVIKIEYEEDELPQTIDVKEDEERQRIRGATKYAQLGSNAHQRLLQADTAM